MIAKNDLSCKKMHAEVCLDSDFYAYQAMLRFLRNKKFLKKIVSVFLRTGHLRECRHANFSKVKINNSGLSCFDYLNADIKSPEIQLNPYLLPVKKKCKPKRHRGTITSLWINKKGKKDKVCDLCL